MVKSSVRGYRETARSIRNMRNMQRPISEASRFALQPILRSAKSNLRTNGNVRYGHLLRGMAIRKKKSRRGMSKTVVAATGRGVKTAHLVEFGTDRHWQPKRNRMHPGARAFPFLTPAFATHDKESIKRFGEEMGKATERHARRVATRRR